MISSQLDTEFTLKSTDQKKYDNIKKVYSIWICTDTSEKRQNSIEKYSMNKEMLFGQNDDDYRYDLLSAIIVNLGKVYDNEDTDSRMLNVLSILVDSNMDASKKIHMLKDKYDVPVTHEIEKEVTTMTSYTANIIAKGEARGKAIGETIGEARGRTLGRIDEIFHSVQDGDYSTKRGAEKLGITESEFIRRMEEAGYKVPTTA